MLGKPDTGPGPRRGPGRSGSSLGVRAFGLFMCLVVSVLSISQAAHATPYGSWVTLPDPSFGSRGVLVTQVVPGEANAATSIALEPGGDVLVGGSAGPGQAALGGSPGGFVARLLPTGRFDSSFGGSGFVRPAGLTAVAQVEPAYNGDVLALGGSLMLLEHGGKTIAAFGVNGAALMPGGFVPQRFAVEQDGSIALVGTVARGGGEEAAVVRLTAGGRPDPTFGSDGIVVLPPPTDELGHQLKSVTPGGLVVQPNGDIVLTLRGVTLATPTFESPVSVLERVTSAGVLDASFGTNGQAVIGRIGEEVGVFDPVVGAGGDILVGMFVSGGTGADSYLAVWRVSADGLALAEEPSVERLPLRYPVGGFVALRHGFGFLLRSEGSSLEASLVSIGADSTKTSNLLSSEELTLPDGATDHEGLVAAQADGKLILAGSAPLANGEEGIFLERLDGVSAPATIKLPKRAVHRGLRSVTLRLSCGRARSCDGLGELSSSPNAIVCFASSRQFSIAPGHSRTVVLRFSQAGRSRFSRRARTRVKLTVTLNDGPERSASITIPARR
jgi:uncharacterized delta-60 repeat protein